MRVQLYGFFALFSIVYLYSITSIKAIQAAFIENFDKVRQ